MVVAGNSPFLSRLFRPKVLYLPCTNEIATTRYAGYAVPSRSSFISTKNYQFLEHFVCLCGRALKYQVYKNSRYSYTKVQTSGRILLQSLRQHSKKFGTIIRTKFNYEFLDCKPVRNRDRRNNSASYAGKVWIRASVETEWGLGATLNISLEWDSRDALENPRFRRFAPKRKKKPRLFCSVMNFTLTATP